MNINELIAELAERLGLKESAQHDAECSLMASINREVNGEVIIFVRDEVNFCPIIR